MNKKDLNYYIKECANHEEKKIYIEMPKFGKICRSCLKKFQDDATYKKKKFVKEVKCMNCGKLMIEEWGYRWVKYFKSVVVRIKKTKWQCKECFDFNEENKK